MEPQILVMSSNLIIWGLMMPSIPFASKRNGEFSYTDSQNALARRVFDCKHNYDYLSCITDPPSLVTLAFGAQQCSKSHADG